MPDNQPLANHQCPLCDQANGCAPAQTNSFAEVCWCQTRTFPPDLLAQVDPSQRNKSCICQHCLNHFHIQ